MALDLDGNEEVIDEAWFERAKKFRADHAASQEAKRQWKATRKRPTPIIEDN